MQLLKDPREPIPATAKHGKRVDDEYERAGTANIFLLTEPLAGWREVAVRERKTKLNWATEMARLLEGRYADCERVVLVCDHSIRQRRVEVVKNRQTPSAPRKHRENRCLPHAWQVDEKIPANSSRN